MIITPLHTYSSKMLICIFSLYPSQPSFSVAFLHSCHSVSFANVDHLQEAAQRFQKRLVVLGRDIKSLPVWQDLKERVDQFKVLVPLIQDMKNPALRSRHWEQLKVEVGKPFDPESSEFTLQLLFALGLDACADVVGNMSASATKELAIEESLKNIEVQWGKIYLELIPHKDTEYYRLKSADEIYQVLEVSLLSPAVVLPQ